MQATTNRKILYFILAAILLIICSVILAKNYLYILNVINNRKIESIKTTRGFNEVNENFKTEPYDYNKNRVQYSEKTKQSHMENAEDKDGKGCERIKIFLKKKDVLFCVNNRNKIKSNDTKTSNLDVKNKNEAKKNDVRTLQRKGRKRREHPKENLELIEKYVEIYGKHKRTKNCADDGDFENVKRNKMITLESKIKNMREEPNNIGTCSLDIKNEKDNPCLKHQMIENSKDGKNTDSPFVNNSKTDNYDKNVVNKVSDLPKNPQNFNKDSVSFFLEECGKKDEATVEDLCTKLQKLNIATQNI